MGITARGRLIPCQKSTQTETNRLLCTLGLSGIGLTQDLEPVKIVYKKGKYDHVNIISFPKSSVRGKKPVTKGGENGGKLKRNIHPVIFFYFQ